jgi:hypothetical protein
MAKKKLNAYEQAQRQFVQSRIAQSGQEATPELRARFRQRFENLAQEKSGRTKIAQRVLADATPEERKSFKRTLATELPSRKIVNTSGTTTTPTGPIYGPTYAPISQEDKRLQRSRGTMGPVVSKTQNVSTSGGQGDRGKYTVGQLTSGVTGAISNRRNNVIGQGINYPGRGFVESITNPFGGAGRVEFSGKGILKAVGVEAAEAFTVAGPAGKVAAKGIGLTKKVLGFGLRQVGRGLIRADQQSPTPAAQSKPIEPVKVDKPVTTTKPASVKGGTKTRGSKASTKTKEVKVEPAKAESKPIEPVKVDKPTTAVKSTKSKGGTTTRGSKANPQKKSDLAYPTPLSRQVREELANPSSQVSQGLGRIAKFLEDNPKGELPMALRAERTTPKATGKNDPFGAIPSWLDKTFVKQYESALETVKNRGAGWQQAKVFVRTQANIQKYGKLKGFK